MTYSAFQSVLLTLGFATFAVAQGPQIQQEAFGVSSGQPADSASQLEIRLTKPVDGEARLLFLGGVPGNSGVILIAGRRADVDGPSGSKLYLDGPTHLARGRFDRDGRFELPVRVSDLSGTAFFQGLHFGATSDHVYPTFQTSHGLSVHIVEPQTEEESSTEPDFSLFRIELGRNRSGEFVTGISNLDLPAVLRAALNSPGDSVQLQLTGKITVPAGIPGVAIGGKVAFTATARRTAEQFEVSIGQDIAFVCGLKATDEVGIEGGRSIGIEAIHSYATASEAARGVRSIALIMALGNAGNLANERSQKALRKARAARAVVYGRISRLANFARGFAGKRARKALDRLLEVRQRAYMASRRAGNAAARAVAFVVDSRNFLEAHFEAAEFRMKTFGEISVKVEADGVAGIGAGLEGARNVVLRIHQHHGQRIHKISASVTQTTKATFEAYAGYGLEVERELARGLNLSFVRGRDGHFQLEEDNLFLGSGLKLFATAGVGYKQKLGLGRSTSLSISLRDLDKTARGVLMAAISGNGKAALQQLGTLPATIAVQDRVIRALTAEFGGGAAGAAGKVGGSATWADCGPGRSLKLTVPQMIDRMLNADPADAAEQFVESFESVRAALL